MDRSTTDDLTRLFEALAASPERWDFFAAVNALEVATPASPRVGEALEPSREVVNLAHVADFNFPASTIAAWQTDGRRPVLESRHLGLTGPMGPLPSHLTEIAVYERQRRGPRPFNEFLGMLGSRSLQFFYRAWADARPAANASRPADDRFAGYLAAVAGTTELAFLAPGSRPAMGDPASFDDWRRLPYGGHLAALRSPTAIGSMLSHMLGRRVTVREAVGRWHEAPVDQRSQLGQHDVALGKGASLGGRFWSVEYDVAFSIRARSMADLDDLLPGGHGHQLMAEAARSALPHHVNWRAHVAIAEHLIEPARLGGRGGVPTRLGWTSWMAPRGRARLRKDLTIHERAAPAPAAAGNLEEAA
ncbi:type VI secretion protein [Polymorphobacter multimanifer]|uniref:Type VI secretion system protein ImpH n=1 Tax=Polymorphobacter multimanifer TaxID=1070431 RepID=A0A841L5C5_9SPHN|nr:type VI secretion system baseplate subunit TssG [Polymorphobacter multimanifer]MBB6227466.1 type VI secretion system protein ImpH [Polymorphobacter multimanifer]GGI68195.1 type VI secretion protein [Polymorphobacter multimanifer]